MRDSPLLTNDLRGIVDGSSLTDLQRAYSLGRSSVQRLLREAGVRRRNSLTEVDVALLVERYEAGLTIRSGDHESTGQDHRNGFGNMLDRTGPIMFVGSRGEGRHVLKRARHLDRW
jgi:hypothetical protein